MKKYFILSIISFFILTGCGNNVSATKTMTCDYRRTNGNLTTKMTYKIDHEDNVIKKVRVSYDYHMDDNTEMDGVGTGTDGTTNDTQIDNDDVIDGVVGSAIDSVVNGVTSAILDIAGLRDRHANAQAMYGNINGFSIQNTNDNTNNDYHVTYIIDYDTINDNDLNTLNLSRNLDDLRNNYTNQGFTCSE